METDIPETPSTAHIMNVNNANHVIQGIVLPVTQRNYRVEPEYIVIPPSTFCSKKRKLEEEAYPVCESSQQNTVYQRSFSFTL